MAPSLAIADGKVVLFHYTLRNDAGEVLDSSVGDEPMAYLHGAQNIVPGLERALAGKSAGYADKITVAPAEGYGERVNVPPQSVPRDSFPAHLELEAGMRFTAQGPNNQHVPIWIVKVQDDKVLVESQHPLAGATLHFEVEVFRRLAQRAIFDGERDLAAQCFSLAATYLTEGNSAVRDAIDVSFVEPMEFGSPPNERRWAWEAFPSVLKNAYVAFHRKSAV